MSHPSSIHEQKMAKAYTILANGDRPSKVDEETFNVPSQSGNWFYDVKKEGEDWFCTCPSYQKLKEAHVEPSYCKYIYTVKFWLNLKDNLKEKEKSMRSP
jgi:hypothetical protein